MESSQKSIIKVHASGFNNLYKRLLLQPVSFSVCTREYGGDVTINDVFEIDSLVDHITIFISEKIFHDAMLDELNKLGVSNLWTKHKIINKLTYKSMGNDWYQEIKDDMAFYVEDSIDKNTPLKLSAYTEFGALEITLTVRKFARAVERLLFEGLIKDSVQNYLDSEDTPRKGTVFNNIIIEGCPLDATYYTMIHSKKEEFMSSVDISKDSLEVISEIVYQMNSDRYKEVQFYMYTLILMHRWEVDVWEVTDKMYDNLILISSFFDFNTRIVRSQ